MNGMFRALLVAAAAIAIPACGEDSTRPGAPGLIHGLLPGSSDPSHPPDEGCGDLPVAPESLRVDLGTPVFSSPTDVSNPLFPVGGLERAILLGTSDGEPFRAETTRLPGPHAIVVNGETIDVIASQYVAWIDRRIAEVAIDLYGEDDEGNVWYFGEDVFNYEDGVVADTEGTWHAGVEGPAAMIMPVDPRVGDVWRPENACPLVFEEVTALRTGVTVHGPRGPVTGALVVRELHLDGGLEEKTFAPGYGEFSAGSGGDGESVALAVPIDALPGEEPDALETLSDGAEALFRLALSQRWQRVRAAFEEMSEAWEEYEASGVPPLLAEAMQEAMDDLEEAIAARSRQEVRQASVIVLFAALDLELRYDDPEEIDIDLVHAWLKQLAIDAAARDRAGIRSDLASIRAIRERLGRHAPSALAEGLLSLEAAGRSEDVAALHEIAAGLERSRGEKGTTAR